MRRFILAAVVLGLFGIPAMPIVADESHRWIDDFSAGSRNALTDTGILALAPDAPIAPAYMGDFEQSGSYLSQPHEFSNTVAAVVVDVDATFPANTEVRLDIRGQNSNGTWQLWTNAPHGQRVELDVPATIVQYRLTLLANAGSPEVYGVTVTPEWGEAFDVGMNEVAPSYRIYATREGLVGYKTANGHRIREYDQFVALPSWRSLSSLDGYEYQVRITYKGRSKVVPVWDVGPWNTNDDYWSTNRQAWRDLPRGKPQAQAAYYDGYNNGRDGRGRKINLPNGIDIADGTFWDLGLEDNDWVEVTFLWEGADPGGPSEPEPTPVEEPASLPAAAPAGAMIVDNTSDTYTEPSGTWFDGACGVNGSHRWTYSARNASTSENLGVWRSPIQQAGFYEVYAYIPACGEPATKAASYQINHDGVKTNVTVDQQTYQNTWVSLGTYYFKPGNSVSLSDLTGEKGLSVRYDALAWLARTDTTAPSASITEIRDLGSGTYQVFWHADDDHAGTSHFDVQVQRDGGAWRDWQIDTTDTHATFLVEDSRLSVYGFRVRAHDWAGNTSEYPANAEKTTADAN